MKAGKKPYYVACVSHGKDSQYLVENIHDTNRPCDEVVFVNTTKEFDAVYTVREQTKDKLDKWGIKYTELTFDNPFDYYMYDHPVKEQGTDIIHKYGYSWCGGPCRWGTSKKTETLNRYYRENLGQYSVYEYVGIAADESWRMEEDNPRKIYPLVEDGITEAECLKRCYKLGYLWKEGDVYLYSILKRVSCWCCRNKNLTELYNIYRFLPKYWEQLKDMQRRLPEPMKAKGDVFLLEKIFAARGEAFSLMDFMTDDEILEWFASGVTKWF